jgi:hypothetical protein
MKKSRYTEEQIIGILNQHSPEQIVSLLRQIEAAVASGKTTPTVCRKPDDHASALCSRRSQDRSDAQGELLTAFFAPPSKPSTDVVQ